MPTSASCCWTEPAGEEQLHIVWVTIINFLHGPSSCKLWRWAESLVVSPMPIIDPEHLGSNTGQRTHVGLLGETFSSSLRLWTLIFYMELKEGHRLECYSMQDAVLIVFLLFLTICLEVRIITSILLLTK